MTLAEVIALTTNHLRVDLDSNVDVTDTTAMTAAVNQAAKEWTRDTLCLWSWESSITLANGVAEYDTLDSTKCADLVFHVRGVHVNGKWLDELDPQDLMPGGDYDDYQAMTSSTNPGFWVKKAPSSIRLIAKPNAAAAAASDNYVIGWREHPTYTYAANSGTQMLGPSTFHPFIADKAALNLAISYISSSEGYQRYQALLSRYNVHAAELKANNVAEYAARRSERGVGRGGAFFDL
jgi:hypothetical protein